MTKIIEELKEIMSTGDWDDLNKFLEKTEIEIKVYGLHIIPSFDNGQFDFECLDDPNDTSTKISLINIYNGRDNIHQTLDLIELSSLEVDITVNNGYIRGINELRDIVNLIDAYREEDRNEPHKTITLN